MKHWQVQAIVDLRTQALALCTFSNRSGLKDTMLWRLLSSMQSWFTLSTAAIAVQHHRMPACICPFIRNSMQMPNSTDSST